MRSTIRAVVSCSLLIAAMAGSRAARAQATPVAAAEPSGMNSVVERQGFDIGLRLGYAIPMGGIAQGLNLSDIMSGAIPFVIEAALRITPNFSLGGLFQYAIAQTKNCDPGASCSASIWRVGLEGIYNFRTGNAFDPWMGLGVGYEQLSLSESGGAVSGDLEVHGWEFLTLQLGGEYRVGPNFALGPFGSFSLAQYSSGSSGGGPSGDIMNTAMHEWLQLGVRGIFNL